MIENAISSVKEFHNDVKLLIVAPTKLKKQFDDMEFGQKLEIKFEYHNTDPNFCNQINVGLEKVDTEWFSILEVDDDA